MDETPGYTVLRYDSGQFFKPHADVWQHGRWSSGGFTRSTRLATVFVYLNDVGSGGETRFTNVCNPAPLVIKPKKGMAVVHFPARKDEFFDFRHDWPRTEHESAPAVDEKWIFATWMWADFEDEEQFSQATHPGEPALNAGHAMRTRAGGGAA